MRRKTLLWHLFPAFLVITFISILAVSLYTVESISGFYQKDLARELDARGRLVGHQMEGAVSGSDWSKADQTAKTLGNETQTRITIVLPDGKVAADSEHDPATMENHADRPEIMEVIEGHARGLVRSTRYSYTLKKDMMYVAVPIVENEKLLAVVRLSVSTASIGDALHSVYWKITMGGVVVAFLAAGISWIFSRRIIRPLADMREGAERFARGELWWRMAVPETQEPAVLAESLNKMAGELELRVQTLVQQRNEQQAVLSGMVEGVFAVDMDERVISVNEAGARLLGVGAQQVHGRSIQEVVRNKELQDLVARAISSSEAVEGEIVLRHNDLELYLQVHGTKLYDAQEHAIGAVIVLNDVTKLHRLETVRRDFVANVSHELKTPITSIKGFVETLLDGAMKNPDEAERFLRIVARQTDRLHAIVEDILTLSRIENQTEKAKIELSKSKVREMLESAIQVCELLAREKNITVDLECDASLTARVNAPLMEQAIINLVDNAIKYSDAGKAVSVRACRVEQGLQIQVGDQGCGIDREHQARIFERFYRVDKARSRKMGGTGLGLSIVKHIVLVHGGQITVDSSPGKGTTFTIVVPNE
jgi:two-component system phosphate regulon sensor histidine kinase PhoR